MIGRVRQFLRARNSARRVARDAERELLLDSEAGRSKYLEMLASECAESSLVALLEVALKQPGDIVECGVFRGHSLRRICKTVHDIAPERTIFGLDSFEGFPQDAITELDITSFRSKSRLDGKFTDAGDVPQRLERFAQTFGMKLELRKGYFDATLPTIVDRDFCFIHIDCDTYAGHVEVLDALYDRLVPGGIIVYDDYKTNEWPGATRAVDEFFAIRAESIEKSEARTRPAWYSVKPA